MVVGPRRERGDRPDTGGNQRPAHGIDRAILEMIASEESLNILKIFWLLFVYINGLEEEAILEVKKMIACQEARMNRRNNIAIVDDNPEDGDVQPAEDAAEPHVDLEVNQHPEAEDPQPRGLRRRAREDDDGHESSSKRFRRLSDTDSDSDINSGAEEGDPASEPSSSDQVPLRSRKRSREEDDDEEDGRVSKQVRN